MRHVICECGMSVGTPDAGTKRAFDAKCGLEDVVSHDTLQHVVSHDMLQHIVSHDTLQHIATH